MRLRGLRSLAFGSAGVWLALMLGAVAALTTFIATAGPRVLASAQDQAVARATAILPVVDKAVVITADWSGQRANNQSLLAPAQQATFGQAFADGLHPPATTSLIAERAFVAGPPVDLSTAAPSAMLGPDPPTFQLSADSALAADTQLVAGKLPGAATAGVPGGSAADRSGVTLQIAVTPATASRFALHVGSRMPLGALDGQLVTAQVTGIVRARPASLLVASGQAQLAPALNCLTCSDQRWTGGALVGPSELQAMQAAMSGANMHGTWYLPVSLSGVTAAELGPLSAGVNSLVSSNSAPDAAQQAGFVSLQTATISSQLPSGLTTIQAQLSATGSIYDLVIGGMFAAELLLILLCAGLAADRYQPEFALVRARGSSMRQVTLLATARSAAATVPGVAVGVALAVVTVPTAGATSAAVLLPAVTAGIAVAAVPARCAWTLRTVADRAARRADIESPRRSPRRVITETTALVLTVGAVVALRVRGLGSGSDQLALASPILVALAASIAVGRLYPIPVRALLPLAATRRGPVGFLGLTKAGRSGLATLLPALALVLTLTLAAFGWMLSASVTAGQVTSSWNQTGADAVITATGNGAITASEQRAVAAVPGVRHTALVYTALANGNFTAALATAGGKSVPVGLAIVNPAQYAALSQDSPWRGFPAAALARRPGPVPILVSAAAAAARSGSSGRQTLAVGGISLPVSVAGTIAATPAFPVGGSYVVLPQWAEASYPSIAGPNTLLATGPGTATTRFATIAGEALRGDPLTLRATVLRGLRGSAAQEAVRLFGFGTWTAAALSALALLFGLAATAHSRRTMQARLAALGMSARQARALALLDPLSLLIVGIIGMTASGAALALISRSVISLAPLTGPLTTAAVSLDLPAIAVPAAAAILLGLVITSTEHWLAAHSGNTEALRTEEAR